eukprot:CAMPEP_0114250124 /NCGR_PEP_ID=MMETSP0058-20121206/14528_1 /TAXON_ID=36894 /ORGANISM="Pyramimonas parkeae, CCMP726" /LENGTH=208 /DNA_ID=CAMNT_0001363755 /DNA_START=80 /DNA_END=706 /DNA_ORIENTATION=-
MAMSTRSIVSLSCPHAHGRCKAPSANTSLLQVQLRAPTQARLALRARAADSLAASQRALSVRVRAEKESCSKAIEDFGVPYPFYKIEATIRKWRVPYVTEALSKSGIRGLTAYDVAGIGFQKGSGGERNKGIQYGENEFVDKTKIEVIVVKEQVDLVINTIVNTVQTGEIGDGKIFVLPVIDVVRIRTGEHGYAAERMSGGYSDMTAM